MGTSSSAAVEDLAGEAVKVRAQAGRLDGGAARAEPGGELVVAEQLVHVGPDDLERVDHPLAGFVRAEGQAQHPLGAVVPVVVHFLDGLGGDAGQGGVGGLRQPAVELELVVADDELAGDGDGEVAVRLLEDRRGAELVLAAEVGEVVLALCSVLPRPRRRS